MYRMWHIIGTSTRKIRSGSCSIPCQSSKFDPLLSRPSWLAYPQEDRGYYYGFSFYNKQQGLSVYVDFSFSESSEEQNKQQSIRGSLILLPNHEIGEAAKVSTRSSWHKSVDDQFLSRVSLEGCKARLSLGQNPTTYPVLIR